MAALLRIFGSKLYHVRRLNECVPENGMRNEIYILCNEFPLFCFHHENKFGAVKDVAVMQS